MEQFNQPAQGGGYLEPKNALGHRILITRVHEIYRNNENVYAGQLKPRDEAIADLVDLDDGFGAIFRERVKITHIGIVNRLTTGSTNVLGRIGQIPTDKGNPAYVLNDWEAPDDYIAGAWVAQHNAASVNQPQSQSQTGGPGGPGSYTPGAPQGQGAPGGAQSGYGQSNPGMPQPSYAPPAQYGPPPSYAPPAQAQNYGPPTAPAADAAQLAFLRAQMGNAGTPAPGQNNDAPPF